MEGMPESEPGMNGMTTTPMAMNSSGTNGSSSGMNMNMNMGMSMDMPGMTVSSAQHLSHPNGTVFKLLFVPHIFRYKYAK